MVCSFLALRPNADTLAEEHPTPSDVLVSGDFGVFRGPDGSRFPQLGVALSDTTSGFEDQWEHRLPIASGPVFSVLSTLLATHRAARFSIRCAGARQNLELHTTVLHHPSLPKTTN